MTVLTDTQIVTASGGLVELGYSQITSAVTVNATTYGSGTTIIAPLTVVTDGSPIVIEFYSQNVYSDGTTLANDQLDIALYVDGAEQDRYWARRAVGASVQDVSCLYISRRLTLSAGSHTIGVRGVVNSAARPWYVNAGAGGTAAAAPAFLRVSKIVQATQWPAVTTGTIICTSSTRPASPFQGQVIYETDSGRSYIYNGTAWVAPQVQTNPPICRAYATGTQSLANSTVTAITLGSESYDTDTMHSTVSNTSRITFTTAGVYSLIGEATFDINATGARDIYLLLNGATRISEATAPSSGASTYSQLQVGAQYSFAAGDYVEMYAWQNSGGSLNLRGDVTNGVWLAANFVGKSS